MNKKRLIIIYAIIVFLVLSIGYPIGQAYVSNYNKGNELYRNGEYEEAMAKYEKALQSIIPIKKEYQIRINYALAICKNVTVDEQDQNSIKLAIQDYETAVEVLKEKECYLNNEDANQLKIDIENEIERLKKLQDKDETASDEEENQEEEAKSQETQSIKQKIQDLKQEAIKDQRDMEMQFKNYEYNYNPDAKTW